MSVRGKIFFSDLFLTAFLGAFFSKFLPKESLALFFLFVFLHRGIGLLIMKQALKPIRKIFDALSFFKEGQEELLPEIDLDLALKEGEFSKLASTLNSLTRRVQEQIENLLKEKEERRKILESLGEGVVALDPSARVTFANRKASEILGVSTEFILRKPLNSAPSSLMQKCHELVVYSLQAHEAISQTSEEGEIYLQLIASPFTHKDGALLVLQDKTSDYRMIRMGKDFIANASHELRTPITVIRGFVEMLRDVPDLSQSIQKEVVAKILKTCDRLEKLVRSLLTLTDVENLSIEKLKEIELTSLVDNAIYLIQMANPSSKISVVSNCDHASVIGDADLLELAITNILENGVKYSKERPRIEVEIQKQKEEVRLKLKDYGIGIPKEDLTRIFDRFYTVDKARSRKSGGAGLGLSIVKTIVEKHKGKIEVSSELSEGSEFTFIFELCKSPS